MARVKDLHQRWLRDPAYATEHARLGPAFDLAALLIGARARAGISQAELARRMKTSQSYVARMEGGTVSPSTRVLERVAAATDTVLRISFTARRARTVAVRVPRGDAPARRRA